MATKKTLKNTVIEETSGTASAKMKDDLKAAQKDEEKAKTAPKAAPKPKAEEETKALKKEEALVNCKVFLATTGVKPDHQAGFLLWCKNKKLGSARMFVSEWKKLWTEFQTRPVGG